MPAWLDLAAGACMTTNCDGGGDKMDETGVDHNVERAGTRRCEHVTPSSACEFESTRDGR
jgi:hypothetical protein